MSFDTGVEGVVVRGPMQEGFDSILTPEALAFFAKLQRKYNARRLELLQARADRQVRLDAGELPDFLPETADVRAGTWKITGTPDDLQDRRTEITGPVDRKMIINALNCGSQMFMADFEDASSPTWTNMIEGQINLRDAVRRTIAFTDPKNGKTYELGEKLATLIVRPRGWHLPEAHVLVDGEEASGGIFDFALYFFHNAKEALSRGTGPYFYLPKMESHLEARLWNDIFVDAQNDLGVPVGTIKGTVLIETITAAFEMDEILYELRDHIVGLNCGRWDYIFSFIKRFAKRPDFILPDRSIVTMDKAFLNAYSLHLISVCHKRGAHAMGGMAAQIPVKDNEAENDAATAKVKADKEREASNGHDGTWVAHPALVSVAKDVFDRLMPESNQVTKPREDTFKQQADLLELHQGDITEDGVRHNIRVGVQYIEAWLGGRGAVPLYNLMEDAATAEISRAQIWQWIRHGAKLADGRTMTKDLFLDLLNQEMSSLKQQFGSDRFDGGNFADAIDIFETMSTSEEFEEFLTLPAYKKLVTFVD